MTESSAPDVSVVIPAYRAAGFIDRAIDSALGQEGVTVEVVVVDDCCPMGTADAVEARYPGRPEVRVLRSPVNRGPAGSRNQGIDAASARWVAVLDADDAYEPGRLTHLLAVGERMGADVVADNVRLLDATTGRLSEPRLKSITEPTRLDLYALAAGGRPGTGELDLGLLKPAYRRSFLEASGLCYPEDVRHGEDYLFYFRLLQAGAAFVVVPEAGYLWTLRSSGHSQTVLDFGNQVADTRALQQDEQVRGDRRLSRLLDERVTALTRLHHAEAYAAALRSGRYAEAATLCVRHPYLLRYVLTSVRKRLPGRR